VADLQLRRMGRRAVQGDPDAIAHEIIMRVRTGALPRNHIVYAAHLGSSIAKRLEEDPRIIVDCANCQARREERTRRNRSPGPTPIRETPRHCLRCNGAERVVLDKGLIKFLKQADDVPHRILVGWSADCVEHQLENLAPRNPMAYQGRYRLPNQPTQDPTLETVVLPAVRCWLETGRLDPVIYQSASVNSAPNRTLGVGTSLATMVSLSEMPDEGRKVRCRAAEIASTCYHAAGGTRAERTWQEQRLISYLLGYLG